MSETNGFALPIMELFDEYERRNEDQYPDLFSLKPEERDEAKILLLDKIYKFKDTDVFKFSQHLPRVLHIWKAFESQNTLEWIKTNTAADDFFVGFVNNLMAKSFSSSGYESKTHHYLSVFYVNEFFENPKAVISRLESLKDKYKDSGYEDLFKSLKRAKDELENPEKYKNRAYRDDFDEE